jgi:hypothetical protein
MESHRDPLRYLVVPAYGTALVILASASLDLVQAVWPFQPTEVGWRYGVAGFVSGSIVTPSLAALLALAVALRFGHVTIQYLLVVAGAAACLVLMIAGATLILDGSQLASLVQPNAENTFRVSQVRGAAKLGLGFVLAFAYTAAAWRGARSRARARRKAPPGEGADMLVSHRRAPGHSGVPADR